MHNTNQRFYTYKFHSKRLAEFNYNITLTFENASKYEEVIAQFDNQMLRSIRDINGKQPDYQQISLWKQEVKKLQHLPHSKENGKLINELRNKINESQFIPEYITIVMDNKNQYAELYKSGLSLNGKKYIRFSCSASQARNSTVVFVDESIAEELDNKLNNDRDKTKKVAPSKYNAYKGLAGSSTQLVSAPRICLVGDYSSTSKVKVNWVTETPINQDDVLEEKEIEQEFNRFDGMGLISPELAKQWASELGLNYTPGQFCIRNAFVKGMVCVFDFHEFCKLKNNGNYIVNSLYKDENGNPLKVDLHSVDIILSESQCKLWDGFANEKDYLEKTVKNNLKWGVTLYSPKKAKDILKMNYQFLQTLNLSKKDIVKVCSKFVNWINGVTKNNYYYSLLFLLGKEVNEKSIKSYLQNGESNWIKALILYPELFNDKFIRKNIYNLVKNKIKHGCLGEIILDGNFQTLVSDPYAMMEHVCGFDKVNGLLKKGEYYSNYWNEKNVKVIDTMRAPLTYRSEHVVMHLRNNEELRKWYKYCDTGLILNIFGNETAKMAGSDFDFDIAASTSNKEIINGVYKDELTVVYKAPKPQKKIFTDKDLYDSDLFSFGSIIGSITNKSTSGYALLPLLDENSKEYETTINRIRMCTKLQSAQIDKAKIGQKVKQIPSIWVKYQKIEDEDTEEVKTKKQFLNSILLDRHPYFFTYLYKDTKDRHIEYIDKKDIECQQKFNISLSTLLEKKRKTVEQTEFINNYIDYSPVIDSDCVMNNLCKYIESIDFGIREIIKDTGEWKNYRNLMFDEHIDTDCKLYRTVINNFNKYKKKLATGYSNNEDDKDKTDKYNDIKRNMVAICSNKKQLVDYLIYSFYSENQQSNKDLLWNIYGDEIVDNLKLKNEQIDVPILNEDGDIKYLDKTYSIERIDVD